MDELLQLIAHIDKKNVLINVANLFLLASFSVKSMLKLRALNIVAGVFLFGGRSHLQSHSGRPWDGMYSFARSMYGGFGWQFLSDVHQNSVLKNNAFTRLPSEA